MWRSLAVGRDGGRPDGVCPHVHRHWPPVDGNVRHEFARTTHGRARSGQRAPGATRGPVGCGPATGSTRLRSSRLCPDGPENITATSRLISFIFRRDRMTRSVTTDRATEPETAHSSRGVQPPAPIRLASTPLASGPWWRRSVPLFNCQGNVLTRTEEGRKYISCWRDRYVYRLPIIDSKTAWRTACPINRGFDPVRPWRGFDLNLLTTLESRDTLVIQHYFIRCKSVVAHRRRTPYYYLCITHKSISYKAYEFS
jgi:hypothetical protein